MYCPKCGQPQSSDQIRFCSRCGVNFDQVENLIARDSNNPFARDESLPKRLLAMAMYVVVAILAVTGWGPWSGPEGTRVRALAITLSVLTFALLFSRRYRQLNEPSVPPPRSCDILRRCTLLLLSIAVIVSLLRSSAIQCGSTSASL